MSATIKSNKWYGRFWPPERRKIKFMQALYDYHAPEIEKKVSKAWSDHIIYGKPLPHDTGQHGWCLDPTHTTNCTYDCPAPSGKKGRDE